MFLKAKDKKQKNEKKQQRETGRENPPQLPLPHPQNKRKDHVYSIATYNTKLNQAFKHKILNFAS